MPATRARFGTAVLLVTLLLLPAGRAMADEEAPKQEEPGGRTRYLEVVPRPHTALENVQYLAALYVVSTAAYLYISREEVNPNITLQNYFSNFGNMTLFDQDHPGSNWGIHIVTGAVVYEFYRARSYTMTDALFMTLAQEALFQFTVETIIQPTALENVGYTGIIGPIVGRGLEVASLPLLNSDFFLARGLGYLLNIPVALGFYESKTKVLPVVGRNSAGVAIRLEL